MHMSGGRYGNFGDIPHASHLESAHNQLVPRENHDEKNSSLEILFVGFGWKHCYIYNIASGTLSVSNF
jgi:hypothetical protein